MIAGTAICAALITRRHQDPEFSIQQAVIDLHDGLLILTDSPDLLSAWHAAGTDTAAMMAGIPNAKAVGAHRAAKQLSIPCATVPDAYFLHPDDYNLHQVLRAISLNTSLSRLTPEDMALPHSWLAGPEEYKNRFHAYPEALRATHDLAERLEFQGPSNRTVMPPWQDVHSRTAGEVLREAAYHGAHRRYGRDLPEGVVNRLVHELNLIEHKGFSSYFLVVRDIVKQSPRICGRGSGAASLVAYCLGITNVCPIKHNLYFERFINADRKDPPDIDVDFAWDERDDVIGSVLEEYGEQAAMVSSHILFQPRMAIRETAKVFGLTEREINEKAKRLPWFWRGHSFGTDLRTKLYEMPETKTMEFPEPWPEILSIAQRMVGTPRHLSVHPGGVVITPDPVENHVPVEIAAKGVPIIQWDKDGAEDGGLVKIDLLGNRSLAVIRDAMNNVRSNGRRFNEFDWEPEDDPATRAAVARGDTMGCFYIESPATRLLQKKSRPRGFRTSGHPFQHHPPGRQ
jgi:error-prone DNA polymerase